MKLTQVYPATYTACIPEKNYEHLIANANHYQYHVAQISSHQVKKIMKKVLCSLSLAALSIYSSLSAANPLYVGGYLGRTTLNDDSYFDLVSSKSEFKDFTTSYSLFTGMTITKGWSIEAEIGQHEKFESSSEDSGFSRHLSLDNTFARINLKQDFALANSFRWYIKESLGVSEVEQKFTDSNPLNPKSRSKTDTVFYPAIALGIQRPFDYINNKFIVYAEWQYGGYNLESDNSTYEIRYNSLGLGLQWAF